MLPPPRRGPAYKTKLCALWQNGNCDRELCSFAHGNVELRRPPSSRPSFPPHHAGRRDYRSTDFRGRPDRRFSPRRRHSPGRDPRGHRSLHDRRPTSRERESSFSRSPSRKSERRHEKKTDGGETNSSKSSPISENNDRKKEKFSSGGDDKEDHENQLKQVRFDMAALREDKSHLEIILDEKMEEVHRISSKVSDLDQQLRREKEEHHRMTSKMKKFIKAHVRFLRAQEELKRSQARFERLGDLLRSDILKRGANEEASSIHIDEDPNAYDRSPKATAAKKRPIPYSTSDEAKAAKKRRERDSDTISRSDKYRSEGETTDYDKTSKGSDGTKSIYLKKRLWEDEKNKLGNVVSADQVKESPVKHALPSTGMAARALYDLNEAVDLEDRNEQIDALLDDALENDIDDRSRSPLMPPQPPPVAQNAYGQSAVLPLSQYEDVDEEVDVE